MSDTSQFQKAMWLCGLLCSIPHHIVGGRGSKEGVISYKQLLLLLRALDKLKLKLKWDKQMCVCVYYRHKQRGYSLKDRVLLNVRWCVFTCSMSDVVNWDNSCRVYYYPILSSSSCYSHWHWNNCYLTSVYIGFNLIQLLPSHQFHLIQLPSVYIGCALDVCVCTTVILNFPRDRKISCCIPPLFCPCSNCHLT